MPNQNGNKGRRRMATMSMQETLKTLSTHKRYLDGDAGQELVMTLTEGLGMLALNQKVISQGDPECIPPEGQAPSKDAVRSYALALMIEVAEFTQELDWKPWKTKQLVDQERVADEFADILAFLGIILIYLDRMGISPSVLARAYNHKSKINIDRFISRHSATAPADGNWKQGSLFDTEEAR